MIESLQVGQFAIIDHEPVDRGPNAGIFHGKGPADDRAELYILAEGVTPAGEAFAGHVVSAMGHLWTTLDMSLTGALKTVFQEAERNLGDWNRKSIAQHRVSLGIACLGRRGNQAILAQAGPSIVFHLSDGKLNTIWTDEEHGGAIDGEDGVSPQIVRIPVAAGDRILMVSSAAVANVPDESLSRLLALPGQQVLQDLYRRVQQLRHVTALLLSAGGGIPHVDFSPEKPADAIEFVIGDQTSAPQRKDQATFLPAIVSRNAATPPQSPQSPEPHQTAEQGAERASARRAAAAREAVVEVHGQATQLVRTAGEARLRRPTSDHTNRQAGLRTSTASGSISGSTSGSNKAAASGHPRNSTSAMKAAGAPFAPAVYNIRPTGQATQNSTRAAAGDHREQRNASFSRGLVRDERPPKSPRNSESVPMVDALAQDSRDRTLAPAPLSGALATEGASAMAAGATLVRPRNDMGRRWTSGRGFSLRAVAHGQMPPTWVVIVVGLSILLGLVGLITVPRILDSRSDERYASLIDGAQQRIATSRVQQDAGEKRKVLTDAQGMLLEAQSLNQNGLEAQQLLGDVKGALAQMDNIRIPASVESIASLDQFGDKPIAVARLTAGLDEVYILDSTSGQVISVAITGGAKTVVYGEDKDLRRGRPVATTYLEASDQGPALIIADSTRNLWAYSPTAGTAGVRPLLFAAPANLTITDITTSNRDLYILDASQKIVFRFNQSDGGYASIPFRALETPSLEKARRLVVSGNEILTADEDGTIHRFVSGASLQLSEAGIDKRLVAAEPPLPLTRNKAGEISELAVLDAPNSRIVVFRGDGSYDRQYQSKDFTGISAFAVRNSTAFVFSSGKLLRVTWQ